MKDKSLTIWTFVFNFLILIGAGHGIAPLGLLEIFGLQNFYSVGTEDFSASLSASYEKTLGFVAILSLTGQIILLLSLAIKQQNHRIITKGIGLIFLWTGYFYLGRQAFTNSASELSFFTGIPFLIASILLLYRLLNQIRADILL